MNRNELLNLPVTVDIETAGRAIGCGRTKSYQMVAEGTFPIQVLRLGHRYRVVTADLLTLLGLSPAKHAAAPARTASATSSPNHLMKEGTPPEAGSLVWTEGVGGHGV